SSLKSDGKREIELSTTEQKHQANYRNRKTKNIASIPPVYKSKQTFSKALKKVITALPKDISKQREIIKRVSETLGLTPKTTHKRTAPTLTVKTKQDVIQLYQRDDISWQAPGKRDTIVVRQNGTKITIQKRHLLYDIREVHQMFIADNPGTSISRSTFANLRPEHVLYKSTLAHRVCVCIYHENVNLIIRSLSRNINGSFCQDLSTLTSSLVCDETDERCMSSICHKCRDNFDTNIRKNIVNKNVLVQWLEWTNQKGRVTKNEKQDTVENLVEHLSKKIEVYLSHVWTKRQQSTYFERSKEESDD
ncbi:unnamed protein product, partial [Didymodactylos carnosus]